MTFPTNKWLWLVLAAGLTIVTLPAHSAGPCQNEDRTARQDGGCWIALSDIEKATLVQGMWAGFGIANTARALEGTGGYWPMSSVSYTASPPETTVTDITAYFDKLYSSPANRKIAWRYAYILAAMNARDDDENDRLALISFLREHTDVPTSGTIVAVKDFQTLLIESGNERFEVRLAGITVPDSMAPRVKALLTAMSRGGIPFLQCKPEQQMLVDLAYWDQLFDEEKRLVAYVKIPSFLHACVAGQWVDFHSEGVEFTQLSYLLVSRGLATANPATDALWSLERRAMSAALKNAEEMARAGKLYIHGDSTDQAIESLLADAKSAPL